MVGLELPENIKLLKLDFNEMILMVRLFPDEGPFEGTAVDFEIKVPEMYPHRPPKAKILQKVKGRGRTIICRLNLVTFVAVSSKFRFRRSRLFKYFETGLEPSFADHRHLFWVA
jgi:hypothetical protein